MTQAELVLFVLEAAFDAPAAEGHMQQKLQRRALRGVGQKELAELLNSRSRASEILNRKRPLSLDQIRKIAKAWNVPVEAMVSEYELTA